MEARERRERLARLAVPHEHGRARAELRGRDDAPVGRDGEREDVARVVALEALRPVERVEHDADARDRVHDAAARAGRVPGG